MLIKHFNDLTQLIDVKITDFVDFGLRHNWWIECVSLQDGSDRQYLEVSERLVGILDRVHLTLTKTRAQTVWCLNVAFYHCIGSVLQTSMLGRGVVCELVGWRWNEGWQQCKRQVFEDQTHTTVCCRSVVYL